MFKTLIDPSTLAPHVRDPNWVIVDCRFDLADPEKGEELYREAHIPGARYAHLDRHLSGPKTGKNGRHPLPDSDVICRNFSDLGISPGMQVVAYDADSGMYAARLWWMLRWMGHDAASRCSMAASRAGSAKDIPCAAASSHRRRATSRARRGRVGE